MSSSLDRLLQDFIGLYAGDTLDRWRELFHPGFTAAAPNPDGSVATWTLDQFCQRQRQLFATGRPIRERLADTEVRQDGDLAWVRSGYVWTDGQLERPGRLMMLLVAERGTFRIQALTFSYLG